jgi:hypothetical protein
VPLAQACASPAARLRISPLKQPSHQVAGIGLAGMDTRTERTGEQTFDEPPRLARLLGRVSIMRASRCLLHGRPDAYCRRGTLLRLCKRPSPMQQAIRTRCGDRRV